MHFAQSIWHAVRAAWAAPYQDAKLYSTSWLDGVRGIAALFVVFHHCSRYIEGHREMIPDVTHVLSLPIMSIVVNGTTMLDIFFVVSGYCLSYKALRNARAGEYSQFFQDLSSSTFRRAIRLYLPLVAVTFLDGSLSYMGYDVHSPCEGTLPEQLYYWAYDVIQDTSPYRVVTNTKAFRFGFILRTIPVQFRGSLHVFICLLALG